MNDFRRRAALLAILISAETALLLAFLLVVADSVKVFSLGAIWSLIAVSALILVAYRDK